ncbi:MAG: hypothetical protein R8P61_28525 [Bacteroidia bacterium]|nr:hypothetical protein [Bacteroidia bacterium]
MKAGVIPDFDYQRFSQLSPKVLNLLKDRVSKSGDFISLPTLHLEDDIENYGKQLKIFRCPGKLEAVWDAYTKGKPQEVWKGPMVNFLFSFSERDKKLYYPDDEMPLFHVGQQFYCWLNIMGPRLVVGFRLMKVDEEKKELEIAYLKGGMYRGTQILSFAQEGEETTITHKSYFRSANRLMDATLYPFFHKLTTGEHHKAVRENLLQKSRASS